MSTKITRRGFAGMAGVAAIALAGSRFAFAHEGHDHGDDHGTPHAEASPHAMHHHGSGTAAAWFTVTNHGETADRLISAESEIAAATEIHEMAMKDGTMMMAPLPDGLEIPAGETVALEPSGYHIMFIGLTRDLIAGETYTLELTFETAGPIELTVPIFRTEGEAEDAELETVQHGDLEIAGVWTRHAPALLDSATPEATPGH